ncbi:hypothetical protein ACFV06_31410 [Streptomyces sp. NPDC059618]|uniref:hypothetical protein n=1 Tax=Streptomyces sp. NPDC059618 TaxID=3346887 RepID=UPI0036D11995
MNHATTSRTATAITAEQADGDTTITYLAAAVFVANAVHAEALTDPDPAGRLDSICDAVPDSMAEVIAKVGTSHPLADFLQAEVPGRLRAAAAIERARADIDADCHYLLDYLVENLRAGGDPRAIRKAAEDMPTRLRDRHAVELTDDQAARA